MAGARPEGSQGGGFGDNDGDRVDERTLPSSGYTPGIFSGGGLGDLVDPRGNMHNEPRDVEGIFAINNGAAESGDGDGLYYNSPFMRPAPLGPAGAGATDVMMS